MGVPFMQDTLGAAARLEVSIAWGADLAADPASWTWTEITTDVYQADGSRIDITVGRSNEASNTQPASCSFVVDNRTGAYSLGGQSSNWPNVRRGTPVRVRVDPDGGGYQTRFFGEAVGFSPEWDVTGRDARVTISASGTLRRLSQGKTPVDSPYRKSVTTSASVVAYWPCEEDRKATVFASAMPGGTPMTISGDNEHPLPDFAESKDIICSKPLPMVRQTSWRGLVPTYTGTGIVQMRMLMSFPEDSINGTTCVLATLYTSGSIARTELYYGVGGDVGIRGFSTTGASLFNTGLTVFNADNTIRMWAFALAQNGGNVDYQIQAIGVGWHESGVTDGSVAAQTVGVANGVAIGPNLDVDDLILGHVSVHAANDDLRDVNGPFNGMASERATERITALCSENAVPVTVVGISDTRMGARNVTTLVKQLRECELADGGILYDGFSNGLRYIARSSIENGSAALTLDASAGDPARELTPVDDDQRTANKVTATRTEGAAATFEDVTGPMGTAAIGIYDDSVTVNLLTDSDIPDYASRAVGRGTIEGYRWPKLQLDLAARPALAPAWAAATLGGRIDVTNLNAVRTQIPAGTLSLLVEGYSESIDQFRWDVKANCSPFDPWQIGTLAPTSGDTSAFPLRATSDGSTLASSALSGATALSVATPSGPLWTTAADDFPFAISVGGIAVTVTAISGASSPQTFTVNATSKALSSGLAVEIHQAAVPSLGGGSNVVLPYVAGDRLNAPIFRDAIPQLGVLTGHRSVAQVIEPTEATGLAVQMDPLARYAIEGYIAYTSGATPDFLLALQAPPASTGHFNIAAINDAGGSPGNLRLALNTTYTGVGARQAFSGAAVGLGLDLHGFILTGYEGGPLRLLFCQFTSDASETSITAGSWLRLTKMGAQ